MLKLAFEEFDALINSSNRHLDGPQEKVEKRVFRHRNSSYNREKHGDTVINSQMRKLLFGDQDGQQEGNHKTFKDEDPGTRLKTLSISNNTLVFDCQRREKPKTERSKVEKTPPKYDRAKRQDRIPTFILDRTKRKQSN